VADHEKRLVDLGHLIEAGMTTHLGVPGPLICDSGFRFPAEPPMISGFGTFPVRAYAELG